MQARQAWRQACRCLSAGKNTNQVCASLLFRSQSWALADQGEVLPEHKLSKPSAGATYQFCCCSGNGCTGHSFSTIAWH